MDEVIEKSIIAKARSLIQRRKQWGMVTTVWDIYYYLKKISKVRVGLTPAKVRTLLEKYPEIFQCKGKTFKGKPTWELISDQLPDPDQPELPQTFEDMLLAVRYKLPDLPPERTPWLD